MPYKYEQNFNVLERFEHNEYQNILMGVGKDNPDEVVVINIFKMSDVIHSDLGLQFKNHLSSLVLLEETSDELVVVTKYHEGMPLKNYLENYDTTLNSRINFAYEFLKKISIYSSFGNFFMRLFIDEDQIIMKDDELLLNELLVIDQPKDITAANFNQVCQKIGHILDNIISPADNEVAKKSIQEFIGNLKNDQHTYTNLNEIHNAFKKIYIYDMFLDKDHETKEASDSTIANAVIAGGIAGGIAGSEDVEAASEDDWESDLRSTFGRSDVEDADTKEKTDETYENKVDSEDSTQIIVPTNIPFDDQKAVVSDVNEPSIDEPDVVEPEIELPETQVPAKPIGLDEEEDFLTSEEEDQLQAIFASNKEATEVVVKEKKRSGCLWILLALLLIILAIFGFNHMSKTFLKPKIKPTVSIVITKKDDSYFFENKSEFPENSSLKATEWKLFLDEELKKMSSSENFNITLDEEGKYIVEVRVMDNNNVWSDPERKEFYHVAVSNENGENSIINVEKLDNYTISYDSNQVQKDETVYRNGSYSFKMNFDTDSSDKVFTIKDTFLDDNTTISLWLRCSGTDPIELSFKGYNNQTVIFEKKLKHIPAIANQWRMVQFNVRVPKLVDSIEVSVSAYAGTVWIDDFAINSYK